MKIGITCYPTYGGSGIIATELGQHLAHRGHTIHFISSALPNRLMELGDGIYFHEVEAMNYPLFEHVPYDLALATKMLETARLEALDLLHVHYAIPHSISAYLAREMMKPDRLPVITTLHGTDITLVGKDHSYLPMTRFGIQQSDGVTAVSQFLKKATDDEFCSGCEIRVIPNFVDTQRIRRFNSSELRDRYAPNGEKVLVHLSNFRPVKRIEDVIRIFERVQRETPAVLLMIGDGPERSNAQYLAGELGLAKSIFFLGMVGVVESFLSMSDVMLLPSATESFGLVGLEAMACGVPVVASDAGGLPELIEHGTSGLLYPVGAVDEMAAGALSMLAGEQLDDFRKAARRRAESSFSAEQVVPLYESYYEEVLARGR